MPVARQPLHKRCNVQLSVITDSNEHFRGRARTRRIAAKKRSYPSSVNGKVATTIPVPPRSRGYIHLQSYCELVPHLSVALSDELYDLSTLLPPTTSACRIPFTHFIRIQHQTPRLAPGLAWSEYHLKSGTPVLNLIVPPPHPSQYKEQIFLTEHQLLLSRDFLSLALPYHYPPAWVDELPGPDIAHVLITAPPGFSGCTELSGVVDIMSIVLCYLTFAGVEETTTVVDCVDSELDAFRLGLADVWKGRVKGDVVEVIQRVAIAP